MEAEIRQRKDDGTIEKQTNLDRQRPKLIIHNNSYIPDHSYFSFSLYTVQCTLCLTNSFLSRKYSRTYFNFSNMVF
jgi:hypothetical protein